LEPKILLVDDDSSVRTLYKATLESQGYQVATAEDGEKALVHIKKELPDLILLDIMMPKVTA
jgi:CheY-like chemotaxis protein